MVFYAIVGLNHKRGKLSTTSVYADEDDSMKMLLYELEVNGLCAAGCLERYLDKLSPGQLRLYCRVKKDGSMSPNQPLGRNTCSKMVKEIAKDCGISDLQGFKPHVFRSYFITYLINDPNINLSEVMAAGRHRSVAASLAYQRRSGKSEAAKFDAVEKAMKHGLDDAENTTPESKKMKSMDVALKTEGEGDEYDDKAKDKDIVVVPSAKADSSPNSLSGSDAGTGTKPVLFTFHFS